MLTALKLFARHLEGKGRLVAAVFLLGLAGAATSLATPLIGKTFIDSIVERHDYAMIPRIALALLGLAVADLILGGVTRLVHTRLSAGVLVEIRERLFERCLQAPLEELEQFRHGDLLNRFGADIPKIQTLLVDGVLGFFRNLLFLVVAAAILLRLSPTLALWSFAGLFLALLVTAAFRRPIEKGTRSVRDAMVDLSHFLSERLGALRAVRRHAAPPADRQAFAGCNATLVRRLMSFQALDSAASGFPALVVTASLAWIYLLGGRLIESGEITLWNFVAFILYQ
jgi:ABC-type multidrug transport system fused ATPase/permease subunit